MAPPIDLAKTSQYIDSLLESTLAASLKIDSLITFCAMQSKSPRWEEIRGIDWPSALAHLRKYVSRSVELMPGDINSLYAGIGTYSDIAGSDFCDFYLAGSPDYAGFDQEIEWALALTWHQAPSESPALKEMYQIAYRPGDGRLGNDCEYPVALGFVNFGFRDALELLPNTIQCVAAGFDNGDFLFPKR